MTDQQQPQHGQRTDPTAQVRQTTVDQGQRALEQTIELQRNAAKMALSALEWQETAQNQGLEFTKSMFQNYVQGVEAVLPGMERAMQEGMRGRDLEQMKQGRSSDQGQMQPPQTQHGHPASQSRLEPQYGQQHSEIPPPATVPAATAGLRTVLGVDAGPESARATEPATTTTGPATPAAAVTDPIAVTASSTGSEPGSTAPPELGISRTSQPVVFRTVRPASAGRLAARWHPSAPPKNPLENGNPNRSATRRSRTADPTARVLTSKTGGKWATNRRKRRTSAGPIGSHDSTALVVQSNVQ